MTFAFLAATLAATAVPADAPHIDKSVTAIRTEDGTVYTATDAGLTTDTQFQAGSIAKWACSVAVLRLVDRDLFSLDSSIADVLPGFEGSGAATIRVRDLLANRSGLADGLLPAMREQGPDALLALEIDAAEAANRFAAADPVAPRDTAYSYDLVNWILVQAILEHQTGLPIDELMDAELFGPDAANLPATHFASGMPELADAPMIEGNVMPIPTWLQCAGGMVTTPADLIAFMLWVEQHALSVKIFQNLMEPTTWSDDSEVHYALGGSILIDNETDQRIFWLSGSNGAFKSRAAYNIWTGEAFAAANAVDDAASLQKAAEIWYWGSEYLPPAMPAPAAPQD